MVDFLESRRRINRRIAKRYERFNGFVLHQQTFALEQAGSLQINPH